MPRVPGPGEGKAIEGVLFGRPGAGSFVDAGAKAFERAREQLGATVRTHWLEARDTASRIAHLRAIAARRPALIVLHGAQGEALVEAVAGDHPDVMFSVSQGHVDARNAASYEVRLEEAAFLAGALAAWISASAVLGHLSGERVRAGLKGRAGFAAGATYARAGVRLVSTFCGSQHDVDLAARCVVEQAGAGADIVFTMLGAGRDGAIRACRELGMRQIGDGVNWCELHPDVFIASALADSAWGTYGAIEDFLAGRFRPGETMSMGLEQEHLCRLVCSVDVPNEMRARLDQVAQDIVAGRVVVPQYWNEPTTDAPR